MVNFKKLKKNSLIISRGAGRGDLPGAVPLYPGFLFFLFFKYLFVKIGCYYV